MPDFRCAYVIDGRSVAFDVVGATGAIKANGRALAELLGTDATLGSRIESIDVRELGKLTRRPMTAVPVLECTSPRPDINERKPRQ